MYVLAGLCLFSNPNLIAADSSGKDGLDNYLRLIGYQAIDFKFNEGNKPLVQGDLGSGKKLTFVLDTGWSITAINTKSAAGIKTFGELNVTLDDAVLGRVDDPSMLLIQNLMLGNSHFVNQPAMSQELKFDYTTIPFQGAIGCDFFIRHHCILDLHVRKLYVRARARTADDTRAMEETFRRSKLTEISAQISTNSLGVLRVECLINGKPVKLLVDTGCNISVLDNSQADHLGLILMRENGPPKGSLIPQEIRGDAVGIGGIGMHKIHMVKVQSLQIGTGKWEKVNFAIGNLSYWGLTQTADERDSTQGLYGVDELTRHGVLIDYSTGKLWFRNEGWKH
jgi:predicted aspartyl protease